MICIKVSSRKNEIGIELLKYTLKKLFFCLDKRAQYITLDRDGKAYAYLNEIFFDTSSKYYLDTYIQNLCSTIAEKENKKEKKEKYDAHMKLLKDNSLSNELTY